MSKVIEADVERSMDCRGYAEPVVVMQQELNFSKQRKKCVKPEIPLVNGLIRKPKVLELELGRTTDVERSRRNVNRKIRSGRIVRADF